MDTASVGIGYFALGALFGCVVTVIATLIDGRIAEKTANWIINGRR